jgi:hypothetical protein
MHKNAKNKQVKFNLEKPEDKIIYWVDNQIGYQDGLYEIEEMKPFRYFSQAKRFLEAKNRRYNGWNLFWESWVYVGYYEYHGFTKKELKEFRLINYVPELATYNISLKKGVK